MSVVDGLIKRLEAATGPDRELNARIATHVGIKHRSRRTGNDINKGREWYVGSEGGIEEWRRHPPDYTASLDAAMTLVPEAPWPWNITMATFYGSASVMPCDGQSTGISDPRGGHARGAATPALALCIAALRARSQT